MDCGDRKNIVPITFCKSTTDTKDSLEPMASHNLHDEASPD